MEFMDRVKEAAQEVAVEAKKVSAQAQGKLEEMQLKRRLDDNAKQLGHLVYKERTQGVMEGAEAERLISEMTSLELQIAKAAAGARAKQEAAEQTWEPAETQSPPSGPRPPAPPGEAVVPPSGEAVAPPPPPSPPDSEPPPSTTP